MHAIENDEGALALMNSVHLCEGPKSVRIENILQVQQSYLEAYKISYLICYTIELRLN